MGMYDAAQKREPPTKAVSAKGAQPEPGKPEHGAAAEGGDQGFVSAMRESHSHAAAHHRVRASHHDKLAAEHTRHAAHHREEAEYHEGKAGEY